MSDLPDAVEILNRMAARYAALETYVDTGIVHSMMRSETGLYEMVLHSAISFERSRGFRFHYKAHHPRSPDWHHGVVVWTNGTTKQWWMVNPTMEEPITLSRALAGFTGVSRGAAWLVPRLLLPAESASLSPSALAELRTLGVVQLEGRACIHVVGTQPSTEARLAFWVDRETLLIRRWYMSPLTGAQLSGTVTDIEPRTDVPIDPKLFDTESPRYDLLAT